MEQLIFATFSIKLTNRNNPENLSNFNDGEDLMDYVQSFFDEIYSGVVKTEEYKGKKKFHLRTEAKGVRAEDDRCYYGFLSSGVSGDSYKIIELNTNIKKADVNSGDGAFKDIFFLFYIPHHRQTGYLVLQRKGNFGAKIALENSFRRYVKSKTEKEYTFKLFNLISGQVYDTMMRKGKLKKIDLIKNRIPSDIEVFIKNGQKPVEIPGKMKTTIYHKDNLPNYWKRFLNRIYLSGGKESIKYEVDSIDSQYEEVEFQLEYDGKIKTFFIVNQWRTQPDINVTNEYKDKFGTTITIHNLALLAKSTIEDVFILEPKV